MDEDRILSEFMQLFGVVSEYAAEGYMFQNDYYGPTEHESKAERAFFIQLPLYTAPCSDLPYKMRVA